MTDKLFQARINKEANIIRTEHEKYNQEFKLIDIDWNVPTISIEFSDSEKLFFKDEEAKKFLAEATKMGNKFYVSVEDAILFMARSW